MGYTWSARKQSIHYEDNTLLQSSRPAFARATELEDVRGPRTVSDNNRRSLRVSASEMQENIEKDVFESSYELYVAEGRQKVVQSTSYRERSNSDVLRRFRMPSQAARALQQDTENDSEAAEAPQGFLSENTQARPPPPPRLFSSSQRPEAVAVPARPQVPVDEANITVVRTMEQLRTAILEGTQLLPLTASVCCC